MIEIEFKTKEVPIGNSSKQYIAKIVNGKEIEKEYLLFCKCRLDRFSNNGTRVVFEDFRYDFSYFSLQYFFERTFFKQKKYDNDITEYFIKGLFLSPKKIKGCFFNFAAGRFGEISVIFES